MSILHAELIMRNARNLISDSSTIPLDTGNRPGNRLPPSDNNDNNDNNDNISTSVQKFK